MWSTDLAVQTMPTGSFFSESRVFCSKQGRNSGYGACYILESWFCVWKAMQGLGIISDEHIALICKQLLAHSHVVKNLHEFMMRVRKFYKGLDQGWHLILRWVAC